MEDIYSKHIYDYVAELLRCNTLRNLAGCLRKRDTSGLDYLERAAITMEDAPHDVVLDLSLQSDHCVFLAKRLSPEGPIHLETILAIPADSQIAFEEVSATASPSVYRLLTYYRLNQNTNGPWYCGPVLNIEFRELSLSAKPIAPPKLASAGNERQRSE